VEPCRPNVTIRKESSLSRAVQLKRLMGALFLCLMMILSGACGGGGDKKEDTKKEDTEKK
jgi:hypothetical protein